MSNSIAPGSSADVNVRVTALTTNPNVPAQYKTIILKKNLVNGVNTLTQEMMSAANTKYVIKYDYVLGENITVPANCVLEFDGGSLSNGTINVNGAYIKGLHCFNNVTISGICFNSEILVEWFIGTDTEKIQAAFNYSNTAIYRDPSAGTTGFMTVFKKVVFGNSKEYIITSSIGLPTYCNIEGNNAIIKTTSDISYMFGGNNMYLITIKNLIFIADNVCALYLNVGNKDTSSTILYNLTFETKNIDVDTENNNTNYAVYLYNQSSQCVIEKCLASNAPKFLKIFVDNIIIRDCWINGYASNHAKPDNTCSINIMTGCRYVGIENCQFVPEWDGEGIVSNDTRWFDYKGGVLSINNCIFGGENRGLPIIWKYFTDSLLSISNSQVACGANLRTAGVIVLMNNIGVGKVNLFNVSWNYSRLVNPYGYVKSSVTAEQYRNDSSNLQNAFNLFVDYMLENKLFPSINIFGKSDLSNYQPCHCLIPFINNSNRGYINNFVKDTDYTIANINLSPNSYSNYVCTVTKIIIVICGDKSNNPWTAIFEYEFLLAQRYGEVRKKIELSNSIGSDLSNYNILEHLTVSLNANLILNVNSDDDSLRINSLQYAAKDNNSWCNEGGYSYGITILPQKCNETIR